MNRSRLRLKHNLTQASTVRSLSRLRVHPNDVVQADGVVTDLKFDSSRIDREALDRSPCRRSGVILINNLSSDQI